MNLGYVNKKRVKSIEEWSHLLMLEFLKTDLGSIHTCWVIETSQISFHPMLKIKSSKFKVANFEPQCRANVQA